MPWLTITLFLPIAGALVVLLVPGLADRMVRVIALAVTVATFAVSLGILANFDRGAGGYQMIDQATWVKSLGMKYAVGVDGISLFLVLLTTFLFVIAVLASFREARSPRMLMATILALETFCIGTFVSLDLLLFFLFFEATLFPGYLLIAGWGGERRAGAAIKFFIYTMAGSAFLFVAVLFVSFQAHTFDIRALQGTNAFSVDTARWLFLGFLVAFAVKAPIVPFHAWQPDAYTEAPTGGLLILAGILPKIATYGMLRFNIGLFPEAAHYFQGLVSILALVGILYGAVVAIVQTDLKRLVAYSSISHIGFIVLGLFAFTTQGMSGSVLYMVNHALSTGLLFVLVGMLYERTRTRDLARLGGLAQVTPRMATAFLVVGLASMGLPGLNNFVSEFLVILGTFGANRVWGSIAVGGVVLSAVYFLWAYQRAMHGPTQERYVGTRDLSRMEYAVIIPVLVVIVLLGVYPKPVLDRVNPATCSVFPAATGPGPSPGSGVPQSCLDANDPSLTSAARGWTSYVPLDVQGGGP
jgi:NADH-quinone oxidoreductase subunit M